MRATILVVGDLGRSPRMQYHAIALAAAGVDVDLVGLAGADPWPVIRRHPRITCHVLTRLAAPAVVRALWDGMRALATLLFVVPAPDVILIQTPPAIPALPAGWIAARLRSARLVIDWHNLGYSMVALRFRRRSLTALTRWVEGVVGRRADGHLCVSRAMQDTLKAQWNIDAEPVHDLPVQEVLPAPGESRDARRSRLAGMLGSPIDAHTVVVISPTSWSLDEDFDLLIDALRRCRELISLGESQGRRYRSILLAVTGSGPRRSAYEPQLADLSSDRMRAKAIWIDAPDFHSMLGAADLGLCLHRSASGVDLPMKIADLFGAGVPVLALDYGPVLREIVEDGVNGRLFADSSALAHVMCALAEESAGPARDHLSAGAKVASERRWGAEWNQHARSVVLP